ncbi:hypothetical protein [Mycoplasma sp. OR1901]|uniref:hypothetical protein n=1 Tax=Mycoplasma sp. OR1901 TaxID=2742195 RepID=UPI001582CAB4|nr:hypothetical protein [Mycoplasma sp. OR1901]QKT05210.1 hypothetical protein HTZ87_00610 [Mycoplasma sp. OR1901]
MKRNKITKLLLIGTAMLSISATTTALVMLRHKKQKDLHRYINLNEKDPNDVSIDYKTLLINSLAEKLLDAQDFIRNNSSDVENAKITKLQDKLNDTTKNLKTTIRDNKKILSEINEINNLIEDAKKVDEVEEEKLKDKIINVPANIARENVTKELNNAINEIQKIETETNDPALDEVTKKANTYINLAKKSLENETNVNNIQAILTITLDKKTEVLYASEQINLRKNQIKNNVQEIKNTFDKLNIFYSKENKTIEEGISRYLVYNFENYNVDDEKNAYIFDFIKIYNDTKTEDQDKIKLPNDIVEAKTGLISFLNKMSHDEDFLTNFNKIELSNLEKLEKIINQWLFSNYTMDKYHIATDHFRFGRKQELVENNRYKWLTDNYYRDIPKIDSKSKYYNDKSILETDTVNSDWYWLDNLQNYKLYNNNQIETFKTFNRVSNNFSKILNDINSLSTEIFEKQFENLNELIESTNDQMKLLDLAKLVYSENFIKEIYMATALDAQEILVESHKPTSEIWDILSKDEEYLKFKEYYVALLNNFEKFTPDAIKNKTVDITNIKNIFKEKLNELKAKNDNNELSISDLNKMKSGDFRDHYISALLWSFNEELLKLDENKNILSSNNKVPRNSEDVKNPSNSIDVKKSNEYLEKTYNEWYLNKNKEFKDNIYNYLSDFKNNINDSIFFNTSYLFFGIDYIHPNGEDITDPEVKKYYNHDLNNKPEIWSKILSFNTDKIGKNFRLNLQYGFDSFIYNLSNNNNKLNLKEIYDYIDQAFAKKADFFESNKVDKKFYWSKTNNFFEGNQQEKYNFYQEDIKKHFKSLIDALTDEQKVAYITRQKIENIFINSKEMDFNIIHNPSDILNWRGLYVVNKQFEYGDVSSAEEKYLNFKNFINKYYDDKLINYEIIYVLYKIAKFINSDQYTDDRMSTIWNAFTENFNFKNNSYDDGYFVDEPTFKINNTLLELIKDI